MADDPYELTVALDADGTAEGDLYVDDLTTFGFRDNGAFHKTRFSFAGGKLTASAANTCDARARALGIASDLGSYRPANEVERVVILGLEAPPAGVTTGGRAVDFSWSADAKALVLRKPGVLVVEEWVVELAF